MISIRGKYFNLIIAPFLRLKQIFFLKFQPLQFISSNLIAQLSYIYFKKSIIVVIRNNFHFQYHLTNSYVNNFPSKYLNSIHKQVLKRFFLQMHFLIKFMEQVHQYCFDKLVSLNQCNQLIKVYSLSGNLKQTLHDKFYSQLDT